MKHATFIPSQFLCTWVYVDHTHNRVGFVVEGHICFFVDQALLMTVTQTVPILMSPWSVSWSEVWQLCVVSIVDGYNSKATPMIFISSVALGGCWQVVIIINCTTVEWLSYFLYPSVSLFTFLHQLSTITKPSSSYYEYLWRGCSVHWELHTSGASRGMGAGDEKQWIILEWPN